MRITQRLKLSLLFMCGLLVCGLLAAAPAAAQSTDDVKSAATLMPSFWSIFGDLPRDFRYLPTLANGVWLEGAGIASLAVEPYDRTIAQTATENPALDAFLDGGALIGSAWMQSGGAVVTYFYGRATNRPQVARVGADLVEAQIVNSVLTQVIKRTVDRDRPDGGNHSFPSGHTSATFATAAVLERHFGWRAGIPAFTVATYVAASRLTENRHYASDVIFGAGIGMIAGRAVTHGLTVHGFALTPVALHGGLGVMFTNSGAGKTGAE